MKMPQVSGAFIFALFLFELDRGSRFVGRIEEDAVDAFDFCLQFALH